MVRRRHRVAVTLALCIAVASASTAHGQQVRTIVDDDPRLARPLTIDDCIAIALEHNLDTRIVRLSRDATATGVDEALGIFYPQLDVTAFRTNNTLFGELGQMTQDQFDQRIGGGVASMTQTLPTGTLIGVNYVLLHDYIKPDRDTPLQQISAGFNQPLLRGFGWRATTGPVRLAKYETRIADAEVRARELFVVQQVKSAYYEVVRQFNLIDVNRQAIARDSQLVAASQAKLDAGLGTRRDVLSAEIVLEQDRGNLVDALTGYDEALDGLARVLGLRIGERGIDIADKTAVLDTIAVDETRWIAKARRDNPTLTAARLAVQRNELAQRVAGNARLPQLDVGLSYTRNHDPDAEEPAKEENIEQILTGDPPDPLDPTGFRGWTTTVRLSVPLGNKALGSVYRRARLLHLQSERALEDAERQVTLEIRTAIRALRNNVERLSILEKNIEGASSKLEFATVNFQLGRASNQDITDAQKDLLDAETDYINEVIDYELQVARIEQLLGGFE